MSKKETGPDVITFYDGKKVTQNFSIPSIYELIHHVIISHYLWEDKPIEKMLIKPGGKKDRWIRL